MDMDLTNLRRYWRAEKPGMLQSLGLQSVGHDLVTEQQQQCSGEIWWEGKHSESYD